MPWRRETGDGVRPGASKLSYRASADDRRFEAEQADLPESWHRLKFVLFICAFGLLVVLAMISPTVRGWLVIFGH
jgi:hypothetical protein